MVVICSPDAAASRWVGEEIALFRALHPGKPILAAVVRGEPEQAFPAALTEGGNEPLAADLRKEGDGEALGFLKIVAGIAGVPLDALVQRDAQRRIRRVMWITGGAFAAMLVMGVMTTLAISARNEAARQRESAEGLVEYMLTDLREKLEGVGRLDVQDTVNQRAMQYYAVQGDLAKLPPDSIERRARVLHAMGEDYEKTGDLDKALAKFREAHKATAALLAKRPHDLNAIFAHGQSEYWLGHPAELRGDWTTAMHQYRAYAAISKRLIAAQPNNPDYMMEMGWGALNLGIIELKSRQAPDFGRANFQTAVDWIAKAASKRTGNPIILNELGNAYAWVADSHYLQGNIERSLKAREFELSAKQSVLALDPKNTSSRFEVAKAQYAVARNLIKARRSAAANALLEIARAEIDQLLLIEPRNEEWRTVRKNISETNGGKNG